MQQGLLYAPPEWLSDFESTWEDWENDPESSPPPLNRPAELDVTAYVVDLARQYKNAEAEEEALAARIKELTERKANRVRKQEWLKNTIGLEMDKAKTTKVKDAEFTISISTRAAKLEIMDEKALPLVFWRIKKEIDKSAINDHFKTTGEIPEGCDLVDGKRSVTIRSK